MRGCVCYSHFHDDIHHSHFLDDVRYAVVAAGESETITKSFLSKRKAETFLSSLTFNESISTEDIEAVVAGTASAIE